MRLGWTFSCKTAPPKLRGAKGEIWLKRSGNSVFMTTRELFVCACKDKGRGRCSFGNSRSIFFTVEKEAASTTEFCSLGFLSNGKLKGPTPFPSQNNFIFSWGVFSQTCFYFGWKLELFLSAYGENSVAFFLWPQCYLFLRQKKGFTGAHFFFRFVTTIQERITTHP